MTTDQPKFSEVVRLIGGDGEGTLNLDANADQNADDGYQQQHEVEFTSPIKRSFLAAFYEEEFLKQMMTLKQRRDPFCGRTCLAKLNEPIIIRKAQFLAFVASIGLPDTRNKVFLSLFGYDVLSSPFQQPKKSLRILYTKMRLQPVQRDIVTHFMSLEKDIRQLAKIVFELTCCATSR